MHLKVNCPKNSKNGIEILVGQPVCKLWIKTVKIMFYYDTFFDALENRLAYLKFNAMLHTLSFFKEVLIVLR